ncbi:hypothetical protein [Tengunoibacter tsumagoiensis]|uniref:Uncharacterized protein n=1 Tax=Tengunoibacter tsumagoiensis TaxID=2014871 RepID=A0A402A590_9CHLR|nr:hypothetical protein [Tengunoibacter tsumagoiensis]GCE14175.1 hypothetical protein KTT_40340 [Tengunoibacter tsumagoiensis]GCE14229.1 hypothetical protein KTT_40880 [Tengunoibacter tsumagoiensis]
MKKGYDILAEAQQIAAARWSVKDEAASEGNEDGEGEEGEVNILRWMRSLWLVMEFVVLVVIISIGLWVASK